VRPRNEPAVKVKAVAVEVEEIFEEAAKSAHRRLVWTRLMIPTSTFYVTAFSNKDRQEEPE
jgi:hypothetical protein